MSRSLSPSPEVTILLVDDERAILQAMVRILRREPYRVLTASSPTLAMDILAMTPVDIVVSDARMPAASGAEFLGRVRLLYPQTIRIMLTGEIGVGTTTDTIRQARLYRFLSKPIPQAELLQVFREAASAVAGPRSRPSPASERRILASERRSPASERKIPASERRISTVPSSGVNP